MKSISQIGGPGLLAQQKMNISLITTLTLNRFFF